MWRGFYIYFYLTVRDNSGNNSARYTYYYKETKHDFVNSTSKCKFT